MVVPWSWMVSACDEVGANYPNGTRRVGGLLVSS
jgi:hypothetical protein